jgi:hypothetical protein
VHLTAKFITSTAGAPLPDLIPVLFALDGRTVMLHLQFHATATGPLHAAFGVARGTRGRLVVQQVGIVRTRATSKATDPYPVEFVKVHALGGR